ncbi:MAG: glycogen/starch synthase, partial [Chloroflexi bacterium]|nr:glycogen/starch synthase [Chloroflexota bacterium]
MVASECEPFAKTGGLADVVDALARALSMLGHEVDVFLPRYRALEPPAGSVRQTVSVIRPADPSDASAAGSADVALWNAPTNGYRLRLVDHPPSFDREGLYGQDGSDYADNGARFGLLGEVA